MSNELLTIFNVESTKMKAIEEQQNPTVETLEVIETEFNTLITFVSSLVFICLFIVIFRYMYKPLLERFWR